VGHYHSWAAARNAMPDALQVTALGAEGEVMAITHRTLPVYGVQFHPESIMTGYGPQMIANWMAA
ncbi:MAG: gamma-glutamyl-gamma-aminobutyrate hydrolase family protein, partial [Bacteroidota bacterium]